MPFFNNISRIIGPMTGGTIQKSSVSLSQKLFHELGLVQFNHGVGTMMPFLLKSLRKLEVMVRKEMKEISALEFMLPVLTDSNLFRISGRLDLPDLCKVVMNEKKTYILSPTCEEAVAHVLQSSKLTYKNLPIRLYQISSKFRDEKRPRSGLLRANEFLMKDLYCFDFDEKSCEQCYQEVIKQYCHFFDLLEVPYVCVAGSTGDIGGLSSHEFHFLAEAGQDKVALCKNCGHNENLELLGDNFEGICRKCNSNNVSVNNGIEVGHTFKLGTKFTKPFQVKFLNANGAPETPQMSSFGLGLSRLLAASVEVLSKSDEIRWPTALAPYLVCIFPPKVGSKEEAVIGDAVQQIYNNLNYSFEDDIIVDDRLSLSVGKRMPLIKKMGIPYLVVLGKGILNTPPVVEIIDLKTGSEDFVQISDVNQFIISKVEGNRNQNYRKKLTI